MNKKTIFVIIILAILGFIMYNNNILSISDLTGNQYTTIEIDGQTCNTVEECENLLLNNGLPESELDRVVIDCSVTPCLGYIEGKNVGEIRVRD